MLSDVCAQHDVSRTDNTDKGGGGGGGGGAWRLPSSSADTFVGPACGKHEAVLAEALV